MTKSKLVYISPTGLQSWLECPAKLWYTQSWERRVQEDNFGSQAHRHMESGTPFDAKKDFPKVEPILRKLRELEKQLGYTVLGREVEQMWEMSPGVMFKRILDAVVRLPTGRLAIVDYKSSSKPWKTVKDSRGEAVDPKARTLQAAGYVLPPPEGVDIDFLEKGATILNSKTWPSRVLFLNAPESGDARWFVYERDADRETAFLRQAKIAADDIVACLRGEPPIKNDGGQCDSRREGYKGQEWGWTCPWLEMCYEQRGWKSKYRRKKR